MASSIGNALDKTDDVTDRLDPALLLPQGAAFTHLGVLDTASGNFYWATLAQVRAAMAAPGPVTNQAPVVRLVVQPGAGVVGQALNLTATASDADGQVVLVEFFLGSTKIGQTATSPYVLSYTPTAAGTAIFSAVATDNANATATATAEPVTITAAQLPVPVISFPAIGNKKVGDLPTALQASSTNTVTPITYASSNPTVLEVRLDPAGWVAEPLAAGTATVTASQVAGNGYGPGTASQAVTVSAMNAPVITMPVLPAKQVGDAPFTYTPTSNNAGVPVTLTSSNANVATVSGNTITVVGAGSYTITATQVAGNGYAAGTNSANGTVTTVPVAPTYDALLSASVPNNPTGPDRGECTLAVSDLYPDLTFQWPANPGGDSAPKNMAGYIGSAFAFSLDFPATYTNTSTPFRVDTGGKIYTGTFTDGNATLTVF